MASKSWLPTWGDRHREIEYFRGFKTQIDSLFEDWFGRSMSGVLAPRVDIAEDDAGVTLTSELPGVDEKDIDIVLCGDQLTIKGEKRSEHEHEAGGPTLHRVERSYGAFQRAITIPYDVDPDRVSAQFKSGVLKITLPKPPEAVKREGRRIAINRAERPSTAGPIGAP